MKVKLKLFATFREYLPEGNDGQSIMLELSDSTKVESVLDSMREDRKFILGNEEISVRADFEAVLGVSRLLRERAKAGG